MEFVAIDVETANADMASICQIGLAKYRGRDLIEEWSSLVDPEDHFDLININIHGITPSDVEGKPNFSQISARLGALLNGAVCVSHTHFDRVSIGRAVARYHLPSFEVTWLDSARVARRAWEEVAWKGYGLAKVCKQIGYEFNHHNALEDAKASAQVLLAAMEKTDLDLDAWLQRVQEPICLENRSSGSAINRAGNSDGGLYGEVLVFTGALQFTRSEAANLASKIGCAVAASVTKKTTLLVVGDQDISKFAGKQKSAKHIKAEELIQKGQNIRIIKESDFIELVKNDAMIT